jgi:hypothetical protein
MGGSQCCLQAVRFVASIFNAVAVTPLIDSLLRRPMPFGKDPSSFIARLNFCLNLWCCRRLIMKSNQHLCFHPECPSEILP